MLNGKQRSYLRKLANKLSPLLQIGKDGITDKFVAQLEETLEAHELVKIGVLNNNDLKTKDIADDVIARVNAEFVQAIGNKLVIYREASEKPTIELPKVK